MNTGLIALAAIAALAPAIAAAQPDSRYSTPENDRPAWERQAQSQPCPRDCDRPRDRERPEPPAWSGPASSTRASEQGYYRDYYPAPQYGYTYGSARGRGYGYSYGDYRGPRPYPGEW